MSLLQLLAQWGSPRIVRPQHTLAPIVRCASCNTTSVSCVCGDSHPTTVAPFCPACTAIAQVGLFLHERGDPGTRRRPYAFD